MDADLSIAAIAALAGKRARARMLTSQIDGRAHAAKELAYSAGVTPQTASSHLAKLLRERRVALERQSRHHYFRIAVRSDRALDGPLVGTCTDCGTAHIGVPAVSGPDWRQLKGKQETR